MKLLLLLLVGIVGSALGIYFGEGATKLAFQYGFFAAMGLSAILLLTGVAD